MPEDSNADQPLLTPEAEGGDDVLAALAGALAVLEENQRRREQAIVRGNALVRLRREGWSWEDILLREEPPRLTALLNESAQALTHASSELRRSQADALHGAGVTLDRIARLFGVSRQRVSSLLRVRRRSGG